MTPTPLIHIGYGKTGTTWFQNNFYPEIDNINYLSKQSILEDIITDYDPETILEKYTNLKRTVICDEDILNNMMLGSMSTIEIALRLKQIFPDGQIVIFIRNQIDVMASGYSQYIKSGGSFSFKRFLEKTKEISYYAKNSFFYEYLQFDKIIAFYVNVFGDENVHVFLYEDFLKNNRAFLRKYIESLNLSINLEKLSYQKKNPSLRRDLYRIIRITNHFTKKNNFFKQYYFHIPLLYKIINENWEVWNKYRIFGKPLTKKHLIGKENLEFLTEYFKESNNILYRDLGVKLVKTYGYPL